MTGCEEIRPLISSYVDGEASTEESALIQAHLKTCEKCQSHMAFLKLLGPAINNAPVASPSPLLLDRIAKATYAKPTWQQRYLAWLTPLSIRWTVGSGLVAAGIVAILVAPRVMQPTPEMTEVPTIAANKTMATPSPAEGTVKPIPLPTPPAEARPSIAPPASAPIAVKPVEPHAKTPVEHAVISEAPTKRVAIATRTTAPAKKVAPTNTAKPGPRMIANAPKPQTNPTPPVIRPASLPTPSPKTTGSEPIEIASAPPRDTTMTNPSPTVSKAVTIAANVKPETPSFTTSAEPTSAAPEPENGGGRPRGFRANLTGFNSERSGDVMNLSLRKPLVSNSANLSIADSPVK